MLIKIFDFLYKHLFFIINRIKYKFNYKTIDDYYKTKFLEIFLIKNGNFFVLNCDEINAINTKLLISSKVKFSEIIENIIKHYNLNEKEIDGSRLFIKYEVKERQFFLCKNTNNIKNLYFEIYSIKKLKCLNSNSISFVQFGEKDLTKLFQKYAGPLNNFYYDTNYSQYINEIYDIDSNEFLFDNDETISNKLVVSDLLLNDYEYSKPFNGIIKLKNNISDDKMEFSNSFDSKLIKNNFTNFKFTIDKKYFFNLLKDVFNSFNKKMK